MTDNARNSLHSTSLLVGYCTVHCTVYTQYNAHWWTTSGGIHSVPSWGSQQQCLVHCNGVHSSLRILGERAHLAHWHICTFAHLHICTLVHLHIGTLAQLQCTKTLVVGHRFTSRRVVGLPLPLLLVTAVVILCFSKCHAVGQVTAVVWGGTGRGGDKKSVTGVEISGDHLWPNIEL